VITDKEREKLESLPLAKPEVNLSPYETGVIPVDKLVQLPQTRDEIDRDVEELTDSILNKQGLLSPIAVMRMTPEEFDFHVELTNQIWRSSVEVGNYQHCLIDGHYLVVAAGHRRTDAIIGASLREEEILPAPVHIYDYDPDIFISIQIDENNLRREVRSERQALAIVETYRYGEALGKWSTAAEFARSSAGKLTPRMINDTLAFVNLPKLARELVYAGALKYSIGVALGRAVPIVEQYYRFLSKGEIDETHLAQDVEQNVSAMAGHILASQELRSVKKAQTYIQGRVKELQRVMENVEYEFNLVSPDEQLREYRRYIEKQYREAWRDFTALPPERAIKYLKLAGAITGEVYQVEIASLETTQQILAKCSIK
jgi:hypothetical protein